MPRSTLEIISVGYEFDDARVINTRFRSAQTLLDHDVILFNPSGFYSAYSFDGFNPRYNGDYCVGDDDSPSLLRDMARRRSELAQSLEHGNALVVFVPPPERFYVGSGEDSWSGTDRNRTRTRGVAPSSVLQTLPFDLETEIGASSELQLRAGDPFAAFWRKAKGSLVATAVIKKAVGTTVLTIKGTDAVVASVRHLAKGVVLLLPGDLAYDEDDEDLEDDGSGHNPNDVVLLDALLELVQSLRREQGDFELPEWTKAYLLPGETEGIAALEEAEAAAARALQEADNRRELLESLRRRKVLISGTGAALETIVSEALTSLGFSVEEGRTGRTDRIAEYAGRPVVVEVKGLGKSAAEKDAAQLEKWVMEYQLEHDVRPQAILVANGWRQQPLSDRGEPVFPHQMRPFATARQHALVTGWQLLCAWLDVEANPCNRDEVALSLLDCVGTWDRYSSWEDQLALKQTATIEERAAGEPVEDTKATGT